MASGYPMHYQFNVKVVHTLTHLILPGHPTLPFEGFRGKYSVGQAHTYPCGQVYGFDRREGVARPESKHQIIIIICINDFTDRLGRTVRGWVERGLLTALTLRGFFFTIGVLRRSWAVGRWADYHHFIARHWWSAGTLRTQSGDGPDFVWLQYARTYRHEQHVVYCYQRRLL